MALAKSGLPDRNLETFRSTMQLSLGKIDLPQLVEVWQMQYQRRKGILKRGRVFLFARSA